MTTAPLPSVAPERHLDELAGLVAAHPRSGEARVLDAIAQGTASRDVARRLVLESYWVARWLVPELPLLIANAPDVYSFTMDDSTHYASWARRFADASGYMGHPHRVETWLGWCRALGLGDDDVRGYGPMPETIAMTFTIGFYLRRSYEEGLAVVAFGGGTIADPSGQAVLARGLEAHYGVPVQGLATQADPGPDARELLRLVATTRAVQDRCRDAVRNVLATAECRARAMQRWLE